MDMSVNFTGAPTYSSSTPPVGLFVLPRTTVTAFCQTLYYYSPRIIGKTGQVVVLLLCVLQSVIAKQTFWALALGW